MKIGIIGAGYIGRSVAELAVKAGHDVLLSNSRGPHTLHSQAHTIGCAVGTAQDAAASGELVLLAIPFRNVFTLAPQLLAGKIVMDPNNYYPDRDGRFDALDAYETTTSEMVQARFPDARIVKAFNAIFANDLAARARSEEPDAGRALPIAGDDAAAKDAVEAFHESIGYDVVDAGSLADSWRFERGKPVYCVPLGREALEAGLAKAKRDDDEGLPPIA